MADQPIPVPLLDEAEVEKLFALLVQAYGPREKLWLGPRLVVDNEWDPEDLADFNKYNG